MTDTLYRIDFEKQAELALIEQYECDAQQLIDAGILVEAPDAVDRSVFTADMLKGILSFALYTKLLVLLEEMINTVIAKEEDGG